MPPRVRIAAPAKINLRLKVLARETTGYHSLESLFCATSLADELEITPAGTGIALEVEGELETGPPEENLVVRAARRFYRELGEEPGVRIRLAKHIPVAAGLGGGSSDAAATLSALSALHGDPFPRAALLQWAIELGSDVPFFLCGSPLALGWGRGERLLSLAPLPPRPVLVAHPGEAMPTGGAFRQIAERRGAEYRPSTFVLPGADPLDWNAAARIADNDFEPVALENLPRLAAGLEALRRSGAIIALLAGSGASIFGVFHSEHSLLAAEPRLRALDFSTRHARTLDHMPRPVVHPG